jgi:HAMP domain-containing protein
VESSPHEGLTPSISAAEPVRETGKPSLRIFLISLVVLLIGLNSLFSNYASRQIDSKASHLMDSMDAVRQYTSNHIDPIISPLNQVSDQFLPESIPFFSSQRVFAYLKANPEYENYSYREAALNPTNPLDQADPLETQLIRTFRADADLTVLTGIRQTAGGSSHYIARPIRVSDQKCLTCHSTHQAAPKSLVATYGNENGFSWRLGEVVGAQVVSVPIDAIYKAKHDSLGLVGIFNLAAYAVTSVVLMGFISRGIVRPMREIAARAFEASIHPDRIEFSEKHRADEIGRIAQSFERMKQSLLIAMQMLKNPGQDHGDP